MIHGEFLRFWAVLKYVFRYNSSRNACLWRQIQREIIEDQMSMTLTVKRSLTEKNQALFLTFNALDTLRNILAQYSSTFENKKLFRNRGILKRKQTYFHQHLPRGTTLHGVSLRNMISGNTQKRGYNPPIKTQEAFVCLFCFLLGGNSD